MKKTLILVRHAHALPGYIAQVRTDGERPLSPEGTQKADLTAHRLAQLPYRPQLILTSPLLRAVQTAEILSGLLKAPVQPAVELNGLKPDQDVCDFLKEQLTHYDTVAAVSHNPSISYVTHLITGEVRPFAPGSFAVVEWEGNGPAQLVTFGE